MAGFTIRRNDRVFLVGSTGSGKTTLAKALLWNRPYIVILDPKRTFKLPDEWPRKYEVLSDLAAAAAIKDDRTIVYRPSYEELKDHCNEFFRWVFERENTLVYVDEVQSVVPNGKIGYWHARCIQEGRERGIGTWNATQRPAAIPLIVLTEAEHIFVFRLSNPDDRKRLGDYGDIALREPVKKGDRNGFYYYNVNSGTVRYWRKADVGKVLSK